MTEPAATTLFPRLLVDAFAQLPAPVRALHVVTLPRRFEGQATVHAATGTVAQMLAWMLGFPAHSIDTAIAVDIEASGDGQRWIRHFPPRPMRTRLWAENGRLRERFGPLVRSFDLVADADGIDWQVATLHLFGLPLPRRWFRQIEARESVRDGRYWFHVHGALPLIGRLVGYEGWLDVD
jgi:hypothetical protein